MIRIRLPLMVLALATTGRLPVHAQTRRSNSSVDSILRSAIARLPALQHVPDSSYEVFYRHPQRSAVLLVAGLTPIHRGAYEAGHHPAVVWCIRILRSLTGLDFRARTDSALRDQEENNERWFLDFDTSGTVKFFGTWMSLGQGGWCVKYISALTSG